MTGISASFSSGMVNKLKNSAVQNSNTMKQVIIMINAG